MQSAIGKNPSAARLNGIAPAGSRQGIPPRPNISLAWEWIGTEIAAEYMEKNFERNRRKRVRWIETLTAMMADGEFFPIHQGIAFDEEGNLIDGQHRLEAIMSSGCGQWMCVARGVMRAHVIAMDRHARRNESDQIRVIDGDLEITSSDVSIARMMHGGGRERSTLAGVQLMRFLADHLDAIRFSRSTTNKRGMAGGPVRGAIARAYYYADRERLADFIRVLESGEPSGPGDQAAMKLRDKLQTSLYLTKGGRSARIECYKYTLTAIVAFLDRRHIKALCMTQQELFPLPESREKTEAGE